MVSFGGYWSVLPSLLGKLFKKPVYIILHGTDCTAFPSINYGSLRKPLLKKACEITYHYATTLLPVSESLIYSSNTYSTFKNTTEHLQGIKHFFPQINTPYKVILNGVNDQFWHQESHIVKQPNTFITVISTGQFTLKGGDLILEVAPLFPSHTFTFAGMDCPTDIIPPDNVLFLGKVSPEELRTLFSTSTYHFQLSISEGFGMSLCEAMLCGCIPIGSAVNMIPEIIGETGFILEKRSMKDLTTLLKQIATEQNNTALGKSARTQIISDFSIEKRAFKLLKEVL